MQVILYSKDNCQECERIKMLLDRLNVFQLEYKLSKDFNEKQFIAEFGTEAQYPQVAIDYQHIGGLKETLHYLKQKGIV